MAKAQLQARGTPWSRPTRRLAALLLAGTVLATMPAMAQQKVVPASSAFQDPLASTDTETDTDTSATGSTSGTPGTTGAIPARAPMSDEDAARLVETTPGENGAFLPAERRTERLNQREADLDNVRSNFGNPYDPIGIRLGTFILKPSLSQGINHEKTKTGSVSTSRSFWQTGLKGSLTSDWSRHQLTIDAEGIHQRNISGTGETEPKVNVNADLRLDLSNDTIANLTAGYAFERESSSDPNAINGATTQSGVHKFAAGASLKRDFGLIRGTISADFDREVYGDAALQDGSKLDLSDRNFSAGTLTGRVGYALSPALIPYLEASVGRSFYDQKRDSLGYERSALTLGGRAGVEVDLGEKLRGDLGLGYKRASFDDSRLAALQGIALDGAVFWSPQRGTDLRLGLRTELEPSTAPGQSGYVEYTTDATLTHELRDNLVARLTGAYTWRDFKSATAIPNQSVYLAGAGLTWNLNRWLALTGDVSYELTRQRDTDDTGITRAGIGLVLRR
ncbi:outer membrane beta-barrel protein [Shinella sumterensis]|uniref:Outer membrane beta-barrel protein n=1 Tax=Shinella sumterensis TaxID=1967501 RepID=A0AA50CNF3_9HYPH|nr:outer membrane beta-barrel protein [Shinella sumterensis]WLR97659.1 outer membrane beta-barrel protein [Shinella sumterensis]